MKKKKLEAKLSKTRKKPAKTKTELDAMLAIIDQSGMPKAGSEPFVGDEGKPGDAATVKKPVGKAVTPAGRKPAAKRPAAGKSTK